MPGLNHLIREGAICKSLRSKQLFYQAEEDESDIVNAAPFWCQRTQSVVGPDGRLVGHAECRPGRSCCQTS